MTFREYQAAPGLNASALKVGAKSMLHMSHAILHGQDSTPAMSLGTLTHAAVLDPTALLTLAAVWEGGDRRGGAYKDFCEANPGRIIVKPDELADVHGMMAAVRANRKAAELLEGCRFEYSIFWDGGAGIGAAKCRPDAVKPGTLVDLKTVSNIDRRAVERQGLSLGYDIQMGWYGMGCAAAGFGDVVPSTWLLYVESQPPYDVWPVRCGFDVIERGVKRAVQIATRYRECEAAGVWPGVAGADDVWTLPAWAQDEQLEGFDQ